MELIFGIKIQDIFFVFLLLTLIGIRKIEIFVFVALLLFFVAIPLFYFQIFFTAQRLIYYAFGLLLVGSIWYLFVNKRDVKSSVKNV